MASEKLFEGRIKKWLHSVGIYAAGTPSDKMKVKQVGWFLKVWGGGFTKAGIPDLLMCVNGIFMGVELKGAVGRASELQKLNITRINAANGIGLILYPDGFGDFKEIIKEVINWHSGLIPALNVTKNAHTSTSCVILRG